MGKLDLYGELFPEFIIKNEKWFVIENSTFEKNCR